MGHRAFTLLELLVVLAVIALLAAMVLASVSRTRIAAQQTKSLANGRSLHAVIESYAGVRKDLFPVADPDVSYPSPSSTLAITIPVWNNRWYWPFVIAQTDGWTPLLDVASSPGRRRGDSEPLPISSYELTDTVCAPASVWARAMNSDPPGPRAQRTSDVFHPSAKVLLFDNDLTYLRRDIKLYSGDLLESTPAAFVDGHARLVVPAYASEPVTNRLNPESGTAYQRLHNTADGVRGVDY